MAAALAIILLIFAAVAAAWFERDKRTGSRIHAGLLGLITLLIVPVQAIFSFFSMQVFSQGVDRSSSRARSARSRPPAG